MEISPIILSEAILQSNTSKIHEELNELLQKLETKTLEEFLYIRKSVEIKNIDYSIYQLIVYILNYKHKSNDAIVKELAQVIFTIVSHLKKGVVTADLKSIFIFLSVNCYVKTNIIDLLTKNELSENQNLSENILKLLLNIKLETTAPPETPYHEKKIMNDSIEGFKDDNIKLAYEFIESMERGKGLHFNYLFENLISFYFQLNFIYFSKALSSLNNPQSFVIYLQGFDKKDLLQIANEQKLKNKWLCFELIRQIVEKEEKGNIEPNDCYSIQILIHKIKVEDFSFLKQTIQYFNRSQLFNASLGESLILFTEEEIKEVIDCFEIDIYTFNYDARKQLLQYYSSKSTDEQLKFLFSIVYNKWDKFFIDLFANEDLYQDNLVITDFCDFIVGYYIIHWENNDILIKIKELIIKIKFIDSEWSLSESNQKTKINLYYSILYLLSYVYLDKNISDRETLNLFLELKHNRIHINRYFDNKKSDVLGTIEKNLQ